LAELAIPIPLRCRTSGELRVPQLTMICLRARTILDSGWPLDRNLVGTTCTPTARPFSMTTLSALVEHMRCRFECTARVLWM